MISKIASKIYTTFLLIELVKYTLDFHELVRPEDPAQRHISLRVKGVDLLLGQSRDPPEECASGEESRPLPPRRNLSSSVPKVRRPKRGGSFVSSPTVS